MVLSPSMTNVRGIDEVAPAFRWYVRFLTTPAAIAIPDTFNLLMTSIEQPRREANETIDVRLHGHHIMRPGIMDMSHSITLTSLETIRNPNTALIWNWQQLLWDWDTGVQQNITDIQADLELTRLDNKNQPIWQYVLYGCRPDDADPGGELGTDADAIRPTITMYYDTFNSLAL